MTRKTLGRADRVEGAVPLVADPVKRERPQPYGGQSIEDLMTEIVTPLLAARLLDDAVVLFKQHFPEDWGECQNWPLQHAIPHLIAKLRSV